MMQQLRAGNLCIECSRNVDCVGQQPATCISCRTYTHEFFRRRRLTFQLFVMFR